MEELEQKRVSLRRLKGLKGATGTQAAMLELFDGDADKVMEVERRFLEKIGGEGTESFSAVGQVAPRVVDAQVLGAIANLCAVIEKIATDIRLLASFKEIEEPRELEQIGSSAMAYKRNPMRSERATGTGRVGVSQAAVALDMVGDQWLERTLDDSSTRRVILPTAFLAADSVLSIMNNVVRGFEVYPAIIRKRLMDELPFLASENIMTAAVKAGGDRHALHEAIKDHSMKAGEEVKKFGRPNDLIQRLKEDKDKLFDSVDLDAAMDPDRYVGLAPQQVDMFIRKEVAPIRARFAAVLGQKTELKV
jgi:adenylosuccinate lyase